MKRLECTLYYEFTKCTGKRKGCMNSSTKVELAVSSTSTNCWLIVSVWLGMKVIDIGTASEAFSKVRTVGMEAG